MSQSSNLGNGIDLLPSRTLAPPGFATARHSHIFADPWHPAEMSMAEPY
jgi:hypothetical protein